MIDEVVAWAEMSWRDWFGSSPTQLSFALLAGGIAHSRRITVFLFNGAKAEPAAVAKVALHRAELTALRGECAALAALSEVASQEVAGILPRPLGTEDHGEWVAAAFAALPGRRLIVPVLLRSATRAGRRTMSEYWEATARLGSELARTSAGGSIVAVDALCERVARFRHRFPGDARSDQALTAFERALGKDTIAWSPTWQHGDLAVGNVLVDNGRFLFTDWETSREDYEPWFDLTTAPAAAVVLASRQMGLRADTAAQIILDPAHWTGSALARLIEDHWKWDLSPSWAIMLTTMEMALERQKANGPTGSPYSSLVYAMVSNSMARAGDSWVAL